MGKKMWGWTKRCAAHLARAYPEQVREAAPPAPTVAESCCNSSMEERLARVRDRHGQVLFVTVMHCPRCGRLRNGNVQLTCPP